MTLTILRFALALATVGLAACSTTAQLPTAPAASLPVTILIVRHGETDPSKPNLPLSAAGEKRAQLLEQTVRGVKFTHLFGTHTVRTRQMLDAIAKRQGLAVVQLPVPGSTWQGETVTDQTSRRAPIEPIAAALAALPPGSVVLAALNSENIYPILHKLGVPVAAAGGRCEAGAMCVPCLDNTCYPRNDFDHLWQVVLQSGGKTPLAFTELRYAQGAKP